MFSTVTSAFSSRSFARVSPRGDLRSSVSDFLLALNMWKYHGSSGAFPGSTRRAGSPVFGFSIFTTSAPSQASASVHEGPASNWVKSTTRMPARKSRSWQVSLIAVSSRLLQANVLVGRGEIEQRVQADRRLLDAWSHAVQRGGLEDRRVHDPLVHQPLNLMKQCFAPLAVALLRLSAEQVVDVRISAIGVRGVADDEGLDA